MDTKVLGNLLAVAAGLVVAAFGAAYDSAPTVWVGAVIAVAGFIAWQVNARRGGRARH
jgi:Flp pilus assembly protein TadB